MKNRNQFTTRSFDSFVAQHGSFKWQTPLIDNNVNDFILYYLMELCYILFACYGVFKLDQLYRTIKLILQFRMGLLN